MLFVPQPNMVSYHNITTIICHKSCQSDIHRTKESIKFPSIFLDPKQHLGTVQREDSNYFHLFHDSGKMTLIQCLLFPSSCSASTSAWSLPSAPHTAQYRQLQLFLSPYPIVKCQQEHQCLQLLHQVRQVAHFVLMFLKIGNQGHLRSKRRPAMLFCSKKVGHQFSIQGHKQTILAT